MTTDQTQTENPTSLQIAWGTISAAEMAQVETVETRSKIKAGGKLHCEVVAHFWTGQDIPGTEGADVMLGRYLASETVFTCSDIRHAHRAAALFRNACDVLAKLTPPAPAAPPPPPAQRTA